MNRFENELNNGDFIVSECINCKQIVWPPSDFCNICHNITKWRNTDNIGIIIESVSYTHLTLPTTSRV